MKIRKYLAQADDRLIALVGALAAFGTYSCMYAFRKPFTAATFDGLEWLGIDYKIWLIFAQTVGYTLSKFYGVRFISEMKHGSRAKSILLLIIFAWIALLLFPLVPKPFNILFLLINGFPLGMVWGLVFSYLEGRKRTEFMGAFLGVSFIFSSGLVKTVGANLMVNYGVTQWWMPFFTGLIFVLPLVLFVWVLDQTPPPSKQDEALRNKRVPMSRNDRQYFLKTFTFGLVMLVAAYVVLTLLRDVRDNFVANIWAEQGLDGQPGLFTSTEIPISLIVLIIISLLVLVKNNAKALMMNHWLIMTGFVLILISTYLFSVQAISIVNWMVVVGLGLYMAYVPFNCVIFDRFMAVFKHAGNAGFLMYVADSFGYLGSMSFLFYKELAGFGDMSWTTFFQNTLLITSGLGLGLTGLAARYFWRKQKGQQETIHKQLILDPAGMTKKKAIVIGAGIVGLATARKLASRGYQVDVLERNPSAQGASVRNFGMVWPIGQPKGYLYDRAMKSRSIWKEMAEMAGMWYGPVGSLHMAYLPEELAVLEEFAESNPQYDLLTADQVRSEAVVKENLKAALWSDEELIVDPREAIATFPKLLTEQYGVNFHWQCAATEIAYPKVKSGKKTFEADLIYVCSGQDFEYLYPEQYTEAAITKSKLQMMRLVSQPNDWKIGPALCGGLTMVHYESFKSTPSHQALCDYYTEHHPAYLKWGLNVMVSQNGAGELTIGDSHEYGLGFDPFNKAFVDQMILGYLAGFANFKDWTIDSHWHGIYAKMTNGDTELIRTPEAGVTIINGLGGAGMTLSFGLAEEVLSDV